MEIPAFLALVVPFIVIVYLGVLLFIRAPRSVVLFSLLGGIVAALINMAVDLAAYYANWWSYVIADLTFHLPVPFYISQVLIYGSVVYLLIWRFWRTRLHWFAWLLLVGVPIIGFVRDLIYNGLTTRGYAQWHSPLAGPIDFVMWVLLFYAGYFLFKRFVPERATVLGEGVHEAAASENQPAMR
jgi:hypothetical protein